MISGTVKFKYIFYCITFEISTFYISRLTSPPKIVYDLGVEYQTHEKGEMKTGGSS